MLSVLQKNENILLVYVKLGKLLQIWAKQKQLA